MMRHRLDNNTLHDTQNTIDTVIDGHEMKRYPLNDRDGDLPFTMSTAFDKHHKANRTNMMREMSTRPFTSGNFRPPLKHCPYRVSICSQIGI